MAVITRTLKAEGGNYTLLSTWESTEQTNLVSANDTHVLECDAFTLSNNQAYIAGWTTNATYFVTIKAAAGHEHNGISGAGFRLQKDLPANDTAIRVIQDYTVIQDIEIECIGSNSGTAAVSLEGIDTTLNRVIAIGTVNGGFAAKVVGNNDCNFYNCIFSKGTSTLSIPDSAGLVTIYNCTSDNASQYGFRRVGISGTDTIIRNCLALNSGVAGFDGNWDSSSSNNASSDTSTAGTANQVLIDDCDLIEGTYQPEGDALLADAGTDLSGIFTVDIANTTRDGWDIGAVAADTAGNIDILSVTPSSFGNGRSVVVNVDGLRTVDVELRLGGVVQTVTDCTNDTITFTADTSGLSLGANTITAKEI